MDRARMMAEGGAADRTIIQADRQTAGRGRQGRNWVAPEGNLYITMLLREDRPMSECAALTFAAALALHDAVDFPDAGLKWPNDLLIGGAKTAGILLESGGTATKPWILIGIGVNVASHPEDLPYPATHLSAHGHDGDLGALCRGILAGLDHWRGIWHRQGASALHSAWAARTVHEVGQELTVRVGTGSIRGRYQGLDGTGSLVVVDAAGKTHHIGAGDVFFS